ncbi:MAG: VCBS repeat-containing protein, partial [candidate division WOR-3 bacterium]
MPGFSKPRVQVDSSRFFARIVGEEGRVLEEAVALLVAVAGQFIFQESVEAAGPRSGRVWAETRVEDFRDGMVDPMMFVSRRAQLDPDSGCVEFFSRFDVDNNGYFDLVCADDSGPYLRLYFGSSSGYSPERRRLFPVPGGGNIDLADLDLDGRAELVHSGWRSGHVTIYWGSDSGPSPSDTTWLVVSGQSEAVAVYDLDRDSYLDVLAGSDNGMLYIFWGSASGYSSANRSSVFLGGAIGHNLEVADLDRDGFGDVVASMWSRAQAAVLYWGAGRTPKSVVWLPVSPNNPHGVSVADLNGDCWLDVVLTGYDTVWTAFLYYGSESGFSTQNRELIHPGRCYGGSAVVAWDADKSLDLVFFRGDWGRTNTYRPRVFYNRLDTTPHFSDAWSSEIGELAFNASGGFVADLNYDGYLDLFVNNMLPDSASYVLWGPYYVNSTALPADRDHHGVWREPGNIYNRAFNASYLSSVFDIGPDTVIAEGSCSWVANEPLGSSVGIEVRAGDSPVPDSAWTDFFPVAMNGGSLPTPVMGRRFLQYRANFNYTRPCHLPQLERIAFELNPAPAVDVGVPRILAPTGDVDSGRVVVPRVEIRNYRTSAPVARVTLKIGSGWSWTMTDSLAPLQTDTLFFPDWLATIPGVHAVRCSVYAELDENPANDTLSTTVRVVVGSDVGPVEIVSPPVAAESGTVHVPRVVVRDFGTRAETFPVHLWIGSSYHQVVSDTLGPGASDTVAFPPWLATPAGPQLVRCSTALSRDEHPENDTLSRITYVWTKIDAAAVGIVAPTDTVDSGTVVVPLALVTNLGTSPASIPIRMRIGSGYSADGMAAVSPGETVLVAFRDWVASPVGTHAVRCSTMLAGDTINGNDLRTDSVTVVAHRDAYSVAILAPTGAIDSGTVVTPICRIGNNGTGPELIPARLRIGTDYLQTRSKLINPGETDTIHFPNWVAQPVGLIAVQCSTALAGDEQPENDTVSTYVQVGSRIDAAALAVLAPVGLVDSGAVIVPVCSIANLSTGSQLIPVRLTIGAGYSESRTKFLLPAESDTVGFPVWTASPSGTFIVTCSTALAGDTFRQNDTVRATVQVVPRIDAALTAIIAPSGAVDSGALVIPAVAVTNLGSGTEDIPVQIVIGTGYSGENSIILASGETDTLFFAEWVAQPVGTHSVIANTYLTGDRDPSNDTARGSVMVGRRVDAGVTAILAPVGEIDSGDVVTPVCRIENNGTSAAMVPVTMRITNGYQESRTKLVPAGAQDTVRFPDWLASPVGGFAVFCSTCLAGDTFCGNDTLSDSVHVLACIDAAALNIVTPTGVLDSGTVVTPVATIANLGSELAVIPTWFWIGSDYAAMRSKMLAPGSSDTVQFPVWTAEPLGQLPVRCSTALVQDRHPENDTTRDSIEVRLGVDAAALAIIRPTGTVDSGITVVPLVRAGNNSSRSQTVPVRLQIGSGYTEFANIRLGPGTWDTVRFPVWCAEAPGLLSVRCSTALAGDQHPENDTISDSVRVVARVDAGVTMIVAPAGTVDSGHVVVPCARVVNSSVSPKLVPVQLTIGSFYSANRDKLLMSGQEDTVQFVPWEASQLGIHPVRCSTMLTGDENPINDTLSGEVLVRVRIDAAAVNIVAPVGVIDSGTTVVPRAVVANLGAHTEVVPVHFLIGNDYHESTAVTIEPESSQVVLFPEWTASTVGRFRVACSTGLAGDVNLENDTVVTSVVVVERHDMSCYRVVAPTGTVDSGTVVVPRAMVTNLGLGPEDAPVWCFIGAEYGDMRIVTVNPGESVMVAFREWIASPVGLLPVRCSTALAGDTTNGNDLALDSVLVVTHPDAGVTDIYAPIGVVDSGSVVQPCVRVGNYGTSPVLVPVRMKIGEGYEELRSKFLGAGAKDTVLFPGWVAQPLGSHVVSCSTELAGDEWPENDRKCDSVRIVSFCDAALLAIIAPQGRVDSGSMIVPMAVVANWGISAALVPVRMRIASDYDSTVGVLIPAGAIDTIRFPNWLATQVGVQAMRCSTELPGDYNNGNDFLNATVEVTVYRDAACLEIQVPKQSIDSGVVVTPRALIQNRSTSLAEIPLFMRIGQDYLRSRRKFLASGQADTVFFPAWQAHPGGIVAVTCSVALAGDQFVKNNAIHES